MENDKNSSDVTGQALDGERSCDHGSVNTSPNAIVSPPNANSKYACDESADEPNVISDVSARLKDRSALTNIRIWINPDFSTSRTEHTPSISQNPCESRLNQSFVSSSSHFTKNEKASRAVIGEGDFSGIPESVSRAFDELRRARACAIGAQDRL
jgi:hypothetical protein